MTNRATIPFSKVSSSSKDSPTIKELWAWTLTSDAIAPCSIRDVIQLEECTMDRTFFVSSVYSICRLNVCQDYDFFWLGRVPCRSVKLVGLVVGVVVYEKRIVYTSKCCLATCA